MSDQQQHHAHELTSDRGVLIFRVGSTWCACHTNLVHAVHRVEPARRFALDDDRQFVVLGDALPVPLHRRPESFGKPVDAPQCEQRWIIFHHNNTLQCAQVDKVFGIAASEFDADKQPIFNMPDAQGPSQTHQLRTDMPQALLGCAA